MKGRTTYNTYCTLPNGRVGIRVENPEDAHRLEFEGTTSVHVSRNRQEVVGEIVTMFSKSFDGAILATIEGRNQLIHAPHYRRIDPPGFALVYDQNDIEHIDLNEYDKRRIRAVGAAGFMHPYTVVCRTLAAGDGWRIVPRLGHEVGLTIEQATALAEMV